MPSLSISTPVSITPNSVLLDAPLHPEILEVFSTVKLPLPWPRPLIVAINMTPRGFQSRRETQQRYSKERSVRNDADSNLFVENLNFVYAVLRNKKRFEGMRPESTLKVPLTGIQHCVHLL